MWVQHLSYFGYKNLVVTSPFWVWGLLGLASMQLPVFSWINVFRSILHAFVSFVDLLEFHSLATVRNITSPELRHFTLYKLATKNLHLATIFLQVVAKRRPENFVNFKPCLIHCNVLDRKETFFANNSNSPKSQFSNNFGPKMSNFFVVVSGQNKTGNNVEWLSR